MNKLLTAGCSFTKHCWPTWADYLGKHFVWHKNLAVGGSDNANIARSIIKNAKSNDVVVVMWTGYDRLNFFNDNKWEYAGSLTSNKDFFTNHYSQVERFTTTMDYVQMVDNHSRLKGYKCYHFNAFNWLKAEKHLRFHPEMPIIYNNYTIENSYLNEISLHEFQEKRNEIFEIDHKYITVPGEGTELELDHKYIQKDTHPTPITHWNYLKEIIAEKININLDNTLESTVQLDQNRVLAGDID